LDDLPLIQNQAFNAKRPWNKAIRGDRFFDFKENYKGQITFFSMEILEMLRRELRARILTDGEIQSSPQCWCLQGMSGIRPTRTLLAAIALPISLERA